jgi:hypothetical protein
MFDGRVRGSRMVSSSGKKRESDKGAFMENTRKQREDRAVERKKLNAIVKLQAFIRRLSVQVKTVFDLKLELDKKISNVTNIKAAFLARGSRFNVPLDVLLPIFRTFIFIFRKDKACCEVSCVNDSVKRISSVFQLFQDALDIRVPAFFSPFLKATEESILKSDCNIYRPWGYQILQLSRISICCVRSLYLIGSPVSNSRVADENNLYLTHVELSIQVLHSLIYWQEENSVATPMKTNDDERNRKESDPSGGIPMEEEGGPSQLASRGQGGSPVELFICSIARNIADSCNMALRLSLFFDKNSKNDLEGLRFNRIVSPLMTRASQIILKIIGLSFSPTNISTANQNVSYSN